MRMYRHCPDTVHLSHDPIPRNNSQPFSYFKAKTMVKIDFALIYLLFEWKKSYFKQKKSRTNIMKVH